MRRVKKGDGFESWRRTWNQEKATTENYQLTTAAEGRLKPSGSLEDAVEHYRGQNHQRQGERVAEHP